MTAPLRFTVRRSPEDAADSGPVCVLLDLPCDLECIEEAVELLALHCFAGRRPGQRTAFRFRVALAEALANAMRASDRGTGEPGRRVNVSAELHLETVRVSV
ncbi:MAG: hypothetical protein ABR551_14850, partial [Gemmatimonadales bacterium]